MKNGWMRLNKVEREEIKIKGWELCMKGKGTRGNHIKSLELVRKRCTMAFIGH